MANPNIVDVATINAGNIGFNLGISSGSIKLMTPATDKVIKINTIICANVDGTNSADLTLYVTGLGTGASGVTSTGTGYLTADTDVYIAKTVPVPADSSLSILDAPIYLMEADILTGFASAASDLDLFISYEVLDDA